MSSSSTNEVLSRLLAIVYRSLPMYLADAAPWARPGASRAAETLALIDADQQTMADRIAHLIMDNGGEVDTGDFPIHFTRYNDLSFDYLINEMIKGQVNDIVKIEHCIDALSMAPTAKAIAEEARGAALAHLDSLKDLLSEPTPTLSIHAPV